ncbi:ATP-binding cassette sub-family B member 6, mitochondrial [Orchesella cincta]|uniref:ATP-binding cassette sub-family B member 6, mitochondrial n=1 Tax=Orchesella cincta TaxID=48709 RepID=A0A1D2N8D8_ORCCI|nr:ATP-binding cassette sub-family B member 6, mitochondrial [Orchesella cincta]
MRLDMDDEQRKLEIFIRMHLDRGTESIASTLEHLIYSVFPTIADIIIAMLFLSWKFGWVYGVIVGIQIVLYLILTAYIIEKRSKYQSGINAAENDLRQKVVESLLNFETVKSFGNEKYEKQRYSHALRTLHHRQNRVGITSSILQLSQLLVINSGLLGISLILVYAIVNDRQLSPGDYVLCTSYLAQLYGPLNYLGGYYRELRVNLIDAEYMLEYFNHKPGIIDSPTAYDLKVTDGAIKFCDVSLSNDCGEIILQNVSFSVAPNTTVALVGHSGSGKTSIIRLLLRLLDASSGKIFVDGANIKDVTQSSLRDSISIVPQDTILFNDTIRNNLRYGKLTATDYEVILAAKAAQIHDKIMSLPDGYDTIVGERGAKLSGGERGRVAISRALLRDSRIIILDEATSALDSTTEKEIFDSLKYLCRNRTCVMITHRLAPVVDVDCIFVLKKGQIVETGRHSQLLERNGLYASMWKQQSKSESKETFHHEDKSLFIHKRALSNRIL